MATHREVFVQRLGLGEGGAGTPTSHIPTRWPARPCHLSQFLQEERSQSLGYPVNPQALPPPEDSGTETCSSLQGPVAQLLSRPQGIRVLGTSLGFSTAPPRAPVDPCVSVRETVMRERPSWAVLSGDRQGSPLRWLPGFSHVPSLVYKGLRAI